MNQAKQKPSNKDAAILFAVAALFALVILVVGYSIQPWIGAIGLLAEIGIGFVIYRKVVQGKIKFADGKFSCWNIYNTGEITMVDTDLYGPSYLNLDRHD